MKRTRREILRAGALLPGVASGALALESGSAGAQGKATESTSPLAEEVLTSLAPLVLPAEALGGELAATLDRFRRWRDGFEPVAELDHPYLSSDEIRYGPADPRPLWQAQCVALDDEARKRHGRALGALDRSEQEALLRRQIERTKTDGSATLPEAVRAPHIALALLSWFYSTPEANDLCYGAAIGRHSCRGLPSAVDRPVALGENEIDERSP